MLVIMILLMQAMGHVARRLLGNQAGLAMSMRPVHTPFDGDIVFALSTGQRPIDWSLPPRAALPA